MDRCLLNTWPEPGPVSASLEAFPLPRVLSSEGWSHSHADFAAHCTLLLQPEEQMAPGGHADLSIQPDFSRLGLCAHH